MILVTVGTEKFPFNRLMQWIDNLIKKGTLQLEKEEIIIQYGSCTIVPRGVENYSVLIETDFLSLLAKSRLIIAHCGEGSIDLLSLINKPFILVPRKLCFQEHVDNHQVELAQKLADQGIPIANSQADLANFLAVPTLAKFLITPAKYYAQASLLLEEEFENNLVIEELSNELIGNVNCSHILA
jgi:UDP-N-acetylglucosamine transferase subunit ALG13